ncbi:LysR family transcriptional regulator [Metabacillus sp. GX 13764]|uniref:LysR family transcriptional regulator n=1 Tax=Metabacillus kandeliae TaxID=2900151 RepID=UPI001E5FBFA1|nr:LysR family transcriptional regulator [Metabacillus kandeliae]MCD7035182.1 LysR family transcriptional regulator [Metabacillus kandeliae]
MELRQLRYFLTVAKHKNFTKAAGLLHVSQPALSKMIRSLEEELGEKLIERTNKITELTDAGKVVYEYAANILSLTEDLIHSLEDLTDLRRGGISIGIPPIIGSLFFPRVLAAFHKKHPNIKVDIKEYGAKKVAESILEGEIEIGVAVIQMISEEDFETYPIVEEDMVILVNDQHRLAKKASAALHELKNEEFIFYNEDFALFELVRQHCISEGGFEPNILFQSSQWDFMSEMVAAGMGITILPQSICNRVQNTSVVQVKLTETDLKWKLAIIAASGKYLSHASKAFIHFLMEGKKSLLHSHNQ